MKLSPDKRAELIALTKEPAAALVEDIKHAREVLAHDAPSRTEIRHLSITLRRLLLQPDQDLAAVAAPRIGRIKLVLPDNKPVLKSAQKKPFPFFSSGGASAFGICIRAGMINEGAHVQSLNGFHPDRTVERRLKEFIDQPVLCIQGEWVNRDDVIKYVANLTSVAHSGAPKTAAKHKQSTFSLLARIRNCAAISLQDGTTRIAFHPDQLSTREPRFQYSRDSIDPVLLELMAAVHYLSISPNLIKLEEIIREELGIGT